MQPRILVVEDDASIALGLQMNLEAEQFQVHCAVDGEAGLQAYRENAFDLVILDVMLPRLNGFEVLRRLRSLDPTARVMMLSARGAENDKVLGLGLGAEDYVTKPFSVAELLARVRVVLRRPRAVFDGQDVVTPKPAGEGMPARLEIGPLHLDADARQVRCRGEGVELTATEFDVLWELAKEAGKVLSREELFRRVRGPGHHGTSRTVDNFILQLRNKIETDPTRPTLLLTVRGRGFRLSV